MRFKDKRVIVTGAASGIGQATTKLFLAEGASVHALDINEAGLEKLTKGQKNITTSVCDISTQENCQTAVKTAIEELSGIDILANVAGIFKTHKLNEVTEEDWNRIMSINVGGTFWMSQACIPHLLKSEGNIVNVASSAGFMGQAYTIPYCASKGAIVMLTRSLAIEFVKSRIRVNAVAPGGVDTPIAQNFEFPDQADMDLIGRYSGLRGLDSPENIAEAIAFLASDAANSIHGAVLNIDHGISAG